MLVLFGGQMKSYWKEINIQAIIWGNTVCTRKLKFIKYHVLLRMYVSLSDESLFTLLSHNIIVYTYTIITPNSAPGIYFFPAIFIPATKQDRHLLV